MSRFVVCLSHKCCTNATDFSEKRAQSEIPVGREKVMQKIVGYDGVQFAL